MAYSEYSEGREVTAEESGVRNRRVDFAVDGNKVAMHKYPEIDISMKEIARKNNEKLTTRS